ncbi:putative uronyl 2-sulfotransferase-like isoform X3 [Apostichopus japonicus]|uniref:Putative uronyl 2-sulfotransferase-like isoform X3 n=1 Tax=Stichopus japonicus TaxID=307972 RepID=A0A2G8L425_STIJA|nr:putative uronyl 2-sulfotransferase-like isoform X3 [Apostichopus japonicus]
MVRDPLERFVSEYYFLRNGDSLISARSAQLSHGYKPNQLPEGWNDTLDECVRKKSELCYPNSGIMKLFCGFSPSCSVASRWTFNHAVFNLDRYTVVGLTDDFASTLEALEKLLPDLVAKDTAAIFRKRYNLSKYQTINRNDPEEDTKTILRTQMAHEHEFYNLVRQKFRKLKTELGIS